MKIGVDFGGVIIQASEGEDFDPILGESIAVVDSIFAISKLTKKHEVFIISKASRRVQKFTRDWLSIVNFYKQTSFSASNLIFCEKRSQKADICEKLGIEWFIDDSVEVINSLSDIVANTTLFDSDSNWKNLLEEIGRKF